MFYDKFIPYQVKGPECSTKRSLGIVIVLFYMTIKRKFHAFQFVISKNLQVKFHSLPDLKVALPAWPQFGSLTLYIII